MSLAILPLLLAGKENMSAYLEEIMVDGVLCFLCPKL
jgi:hypothetical protein